MLISIIQWFERHPNSQFITIAQIKSMFLLKSQKLKIKVSRENETLLDNLKVLQKQRIVEIEVKKDNYRGQFSKIFLKTTKHINKE